jgi:hypothetical protein
MHLSALIMTGVAVGTLLAYDLVRRSMRWGPAIMVCVPLALVLAIHVAGTMLAPGASGATDWGTLTRKVLRLGSGVLRFRAIVDIALLAVLFVPLAWVAVREKIDQEHKAAAIRALLLCGVFVLVYVALPVETGSVYDVDNRALPYALTFFVVAFLVAYDGAIAQKRVALYAAIVVCALNLVIVAAYMCPENAFLRDYRALAARVRRGHALSLRR